MIFIYSQIFIHHFAGLFGTNMIKITSRLDSPVVRALHQYRKGHGFKSRIGLIFIFFFFSGLISTIAPIVFITTHIAFIVFSRFAVHMIFICSQSFMRVVNQSMSRVLLLYIFEISFYVE